MSGPLFGGRSMIALIFAPLAAIVALCLSPTTVQVLAPHGVLGPRAVSGGAIGRAGEAKLTAVAAAEAKLGELVIAAGGLMLSHVGSASRADKTRPPSGACAVRFGSAPWPGADARHNQRRPAASGASEPWRTPA